MEAQAREIEQRQVQAEMRWIGYACSAHTRWWFWTTRLNLPSMIVYLSVIAIACFAVKDPRAIFMASQAPSSTNISSTNHQDSQDSQDTFPTVHVTCVALKQCAFCTCCNDSLQQCQKHGIHNWHCNCNVKLKSGQQQSLLLCIVTHFWLAWGLICHTNKDTLLTVGLTWLTKLRFDTWKGCALGGLPLDIFCIAFRCCPEPPNGPLVGTSILGPFLRFDVLEIWEFGN